ncbi:MAG: alpha/beta hydrolase [Dorea sp.]|nr:alpha/beta hydrolase [Dorea sp.]
MYFTRYHSFNDIMEYPDMEEYLRIFFSENNLNLFPKEIRSMPLALAEQISVSPWDGLFTEVTNQFLDAVQTVLDITDSRRRRCVSLWEEGTDWTPEQEKKGGKASVFLLTPEYKRNVGFTCRQGADTGKSTEQIHEFGTDVKRRAARPAVIICPGGAYERVCFSGEGNPVMNYMEAKGYVAFVLKYRTAPERYPAPQEDLALALKYVREHAGEYGADPRNVMLMGFSAGGHLCASLPCFCREIVENLSKKTGKKISPEDVRPDKLCLGYPVITFGAECHEGSFQALTGGKESMREALSIEKCVTKDYPATFLWACEDDTCVPVSNTLKMGEALKAAGVRYKLCTYPSGGHGCYLAFGNSAYSWTEEMIQFLG